MDPINQADVISYFNFVQHLISKNMQLNWPTLTEDLLNSSRVIQERKSKDCCIEYKSGSPEIRFWDLALICTSWILEILKQKTQKGHCNNIDHKHGEKEPRDCKLGYDFHLQMYNDCLSLLRNVISIAEKNPPRELTNGLD